MGNNNRAIELALLHGGAKFPKFLLGAFQSFVTAFACDFRR
jgi:hypothetical protein